MDPVLGLIFWVGLTIAAKQMWQHVAAEARKGRDQKVKAAEKLGEGKPLSAAQKRAVVRRHAVGWWAGEAAHGFPVHRAGWEAGWLAHKTALAHHQARREEARTHHLETRASVMDGIAEHRKRQAAAFEQIEKARAAQPPVKEDAPNVLPFRQPKNTAQPPPTAAPAPDATETENGGQAATKAAQPPPGPSPATANGATPMPAEVNYTEALNIAKQIEADADAEVHSIRFERIRNALDALAGLALDGATLGEAAEVDDALRAQQKAAQATSDAAAAFRAGLIRRHGGIKEAADSAPAPMADKEFYQD